MIPVVMKEAAVKGCGPAVCETVSASTGFAPMVYSMCEELMRETNLCQQMVKLWNPTDTSTSTTTTCTAMGDCNTKCLEGTCTPSTLGE